MLPNPGRPFTKPRLNVQLKQLGLIEFFLVLENWNDSCKAWSSSTLLKNKWLLGCSDMDLDA